MRPGWASPRPWRPSSRPSRARSSSRSPATPPARATTAWSPRSSAPPSGRWWGRFVLYQLGALWGAERLCATAERIPLLHARDVERAIAWFGRNGRSAIFLGRLVPGVRSFISIPAGIDRMPLLQFALYTTAGSLVWNAALIVAGYELGAQWHRVEAYVGEASVVVYAALGVALLLVRRAAARAALAAAAGRPVAGVVPLRV